MSPDAALARTSPVVTASMAMSPDAVRTLTSTGAVPIEHVAAPRLDLQRRPSAADADVARAGLHDPGTGQHAEVDVTRSGHHVGVLGDRGDAQATTAAAQTG